MMMIDDLLHFFGVHHGETELQKIPRLSSYVSTINGVPK
jgi:hypothetical protein